MVVKRNGKGTYENDRPPNPQSHQPQLARGVVSASGYGAYLDALHYDGRNSWLSICNRLSLSTFERPLSTCANTSRSQLAASARPRFP
jgi:hypothetical protein